MKQQISSFVKTLKEKLMQKCKPNESPENVMNRCFKYFDVDDSGSLDYDEWKKGLEKMGVTLSSEDDLKALFEHYDTDKSGNIDYKEFAEAIFHPGAKEEDREERKGPSKKKDATEKMIGQLREKLASRGARGVIGLGKTFRVIE